MHSSDRDGIDADFAALYAAVSRILEQSFDAVTTPDRLTYPRRLEDETRRLQAPGHVLINQLAEQAGREELGARLPDALADRLHITPLRRGAVSPRPPILGRAARLPVNRCRRF
jgi:hypothetical protein